MTADAHPVWFDSGELRLHGRLRLVDAEAPTVVLLSGLGLHTFEYAPLAERLAAAGMNSFAFDYRGHGRSPGRRGRWTLAELASDTRHAIDFVQLHTSGKVALFGNSLGGMIALLAAADDERVAAVAASNCPASIGDFLLTRQRRALFALAKLVEPVAPMRISVNHFYDYADLIPDASWVAKIRADRGISDARRLSIATLRQLLEVWDGRAVVRRVKQPVLIIQGSADHLQPVEQSRILYEQAKEPRRFELLPTGHLPHLESPALLAELLTAWLGSLND